MKVSVCLHVPLSSWPLKRPWGYTNLIYSLDILSCFQDSCTKNCIELNMCSFLIETGLSPPPLVLIRIKSQCTNILSYHRKPKANVYIIKCFTSQIGACVFACLSSLHAAHVSVFPSKPVCVQLLQHKSSILTRSVVLLWCKKGSCLAEGEAIIAPLWIMRQQCDPYLKVNVGSCPCHSPSLHCSLLHYRWWPWQHLIANNIHLNKPFHPVKILTNFISLGEKKKGEEI